MSTQSEELLDPYFQPSKLTENFARLCHLILTICSDLLRDVIGRHISPSNLTCTIDNKRDVLWGRFNKQQQKEIYPQHVRVLKAKDFDISICYILLRNICGIPPHAAGWGNAPNLGDYSVSACIEIIRIERNEVCAHSSRGTIEQKEFQDHWNKIKEAIIHLEQEEIGGDWYERGVDCLWSCSLSPFKNEEYLEEMKNVKHKLDSIDGCIKGLQATVRTKMACKRARIDQLEESQNATLTDISDQIEDLQKKVVDKIHEQESVIDQNSKKINELTTISKDIERKIGVRDTDYYDAGKDLFGEIKGLKKDLERRANDIEWNLTEKIMSKMQNFENTVSRKERKIGSSDISGAHCSAASISDRGIESTDLNCARRSKSFELRFKDNEKVLWVCGSGRSCWVVSLSTLEMVFKEHNRYKIYRMEETEKGLKVQQELEVHEPVLQGIQIDDNGRLLYPSHSKKCVRYVTCKNITNTLIDVDEKYEPCALDFKDKIVFVLNRRKNTNYLISEFDTNYYEDDDSDHDDDEWEIGVELDLPRRLFRNGDFASQRFAILHDGLTVCEGRFHWKVLFTISCGSGNSDLRDIAVAENSNLQGILLAYPNGIDLVDWKGHHQKRIYHETADNITTISLSEGNLWIGHESNTVEIIRFGELDI